MFCKNCGEEIQEGWKNCPKCGRGLGTKVDDTEENPYIFFPGIQREKRKTLKTVFNILHIVAEGFALLVIILHINAEIQEAANYKMMLYIMRFICTCGPCLVLKFITSEVAWMISLKKKPDVKIDSAVNYMIAEIAYIFIGAVAGIMLAAPSVGQKLEMMAAVSNDSYLDYLATMKMPVILLILAAVINCMLSKKLEGLSEE